MLRHILAVVVVSSVLVPSTEARAEYSPPREALQIRPVASRVKAPTRAMVAKSEEIAPRIVNNAPVREEDMVLSAEMVMGKINRVYIAGLQRCYRTALTDDPSVSGKVNIVLQIGEEGHVLSDITVANAKLDSCLRRVVGGWRFPHASEPAEASFKISLVLAR